MLTFYETAWFHMFRLNRGIAFYANVPFNPSLERRRLAFLKLVGTVFKFLPYFINDPPYVKGAHKCCSIVVLAGTYRNNR
jgi:hypothetical protein